MTQFTTLISPVVLLLLLLFIFKFNNDKVKLSKEGEDQTAMNTAGAGTDNPLPLCRAGNVLDKRKYRLTKSGSPYCQLRNYTTERVVACLDNLRISQHRHRDSELQLLRLAFVGDSRIRQQFFNFVRLIPDYDIKSTPCPIPYKYHGDIEVTSNILGLRLSFKWQPIINSTAVTTIRRWTNSIESRRPFLVLLSIEVHHMLEKYNASYNLYQEKLLEFAPLLGHLSNSISHVIWLNQFPTVDSYAKTDGDNTYITSQKIHNYNKNIRRILENENRNIRVWDSANPLVEEYVRSCSIFKGYDEKRVDDYTSAYRSCKDYIHSGYSVLAQVTQILFNDICTVTS